jgi:hypothetical protein
MLNTFFKRPHRDSFSVESERAKDQTTASVLRQTIKRCDRCNQGLSGHQFQMIASVPLEKEKLPLFEELLAAVKRHDWRAITSFQDWKGDQPNAEVYGLKCADGGLSMVIISAPFSLEEPYMLMHQELVDASMFPTMSSGAWQPI